MKKVKKITTTELYRNPSQAMNFVKEGGTVYIGYKNLSQPIAVLTDYNKFNEEGEKEIKEDKRKKAIEYIKNNSFKSKLWKSGLDLQKNVRQ